MAIQAEPFVVNVGPQHPSTHGVFRMKLTLDGERIVDADMVIGYLHRSIEKLAEERTWTQNIPFMDRTDYLAAMTGNQAIVLAAEKMMAIEPPERAKYIRVIMAELQRFASHCMAVGTFVNDCGAWQTPLMYMLREREKVLDLFEMVCGARVTLNYMRIGGVAFDLPDEFVPACRQLIEEDFPRRMEEYARLLIGNEIILARSRGIGVLPAELAIASSCSGPMLRGSGVAWDIRKADPYDVYDRMDFEIPVGYQGDCYDRFLVRFEEMQQSIAIVKQALDALPGGPEKVDIPLAPMAPPGEQYSRVESPRGELGIYAVSDGSPNPYRFHIRSPSYINLSALKQMTVGHTVADAVVILGSIDIVVGEVDR
ncbi:MAG TPA: NADH-quinone oxidoreductase subunit D [Dehalococcoidia bacterium]|nr:NADH-quinone oxidoreductase subunit D [Dehalococcoidia bacterium]